MKEANTTHRTLEEYKEDVFDGLDEKIKLEWLYIMSRQLCEIEELIKEKYSNEDGEIWHSDMQIIYNILNKEE